MVGDKIHCIDFKTEVLTKYGWKTVYELNMNDLVATLKDEKLVYEKPLDIMVYPDYEGSMYYLKNKEIDLVVTGNHRMWVSIFDEILNKWLKYDFQRADNIIGKIVKYKNFNNEIIINKKNIYEEYLNVEKCPVFCLHVPSEVFYIRRNGKECWTGNSRSQGHVTTLKMWGSKREFKRFFLVYISRQNIWLREPPKALTTTLIWKLVRGTRLIIVPNGKKVKN